MLVAGKKERPWVRGINLEDSEVFLIYCSDPLLQGAITIFCWPKSEHFWPLSNY